MRRLWWIAAGLVTVLLLVTAAGISILRSQWLRDRIIAGIVEQTERASGGKVEIGALTLNWRTLTAELDRFVVHGKEARGEAPLLCVDRIYVRLRIISLLRRDVSISGIEANGPRAHVIVYPDGSTNLPHPKTRPKGTVPERILDLKIARFDLRNGSFLIESPGQTSHTFPWNAKGENLIAQVVYDPARVRYSGDVALASLHLLSLDLQVAANASFEKNRLTVTHAAVTTQHSTLQLYDAVIMDFRSPNAVTRYDARLDLRDAQSLVKLPFKASGLIRIAGKARFSSQAEFSLTGEAQASELTVNQLRNVRFNARVEARPGAYSVEAIRMNVLGGEVTGSADTDDFQSFRTSGRLAHFDLRQSAALITRQPVPYDASVSGPFTLNGRPRDMHLDAHLNVAPVAGGPPVRGDVAIRYETGTSRLNLGESWLDLPNSHLSVAGTLGDRLNVNLRSTNFSELLPAVDVFTHGKTPAIGFGSLAFDGTVSGPPAAALISGRLAVRDGTLDQYRIQSFSGDVTVSKANASVSHADLVYNDLHARGAGSIQLDHWMSAPTSPITASLDIASSDVAKSLGMLGHKELPVTGTLTTSARITGTLSNPLADADVTLTKGTIYAQPFDSITGKLQVLNRTAQSLTALFASGPKRVNITARFQQTGAEFPAGTVEFNLTSNTMPLNQIALIRERQPDIHGFGQFHADGSLSIGHDAKHRTEYDLTALNADAAANGIELEGRNLGDARLSAQTKDGVLTTHFESNAAGAAIQGNATVRLQADYPVNGKITFANASLNSLAALAVREEDANRLNFDGTAEGDLTFSGPAKNPDEITALLSVPRIEIRALPGTPFAQSMPNFVLTNSGSIRATLAKSVIHIDAAHFKAPETDLILEGSISPRLPAPLDVHAQGTVNLALARTMNPELAAAGTLALNATVRGAWSTPDIFGRASMRNGDFHYADFSNGLTSATGEFTFTGNHATIQSFTAQSGGGKVQATGFGAFINGLLSFRVEAQARQVRVRYPEGISSVSDATLTFAGTSQRSETSGVVTVHRVSINPKSDAATILAATVAPAQTPAAKNSLASNMNLDVQVSTAPDVALQTSVTQSLQADANLRLRGTATNPALIGRINISQGEMVFFGNKYSINNGSISFFNPAKIEPVLNIDLETKARGVDVILTVSGPIDKLNVNYRSDPPLQFSDIVALLATGRAPTNATLSSHDTGQSQNFQQLGASALIGQAIANPVAGRLQRFFGVSRLKIDPSLTGVTGSPEARLTIEQQVTPDILFTYITDVSSTSTQLIRVEWSFNRHWSAILIREENGYVGLDFAYKKRFK